MTPERAKELAERPWKAYRSAHFDGTSERLHCLPRFFDGSRHKDYGGEPERRQLSGTCHAIRAAREFSAKHPRTTVTVVVASKLRTYRNGNQI